MKGKDKLYTVYDIAKLLNLSDGAVRQRIEKLRLIPTTFQNSRAYFYDFNQYNLIADFIKPEFKADIVTKNIDTIVYHVTWHIRDSKLNFLTLEQLEQQ